jgi:hypothetical protein
LDLIYSSIDRPTVTIERERVMVFNATFNKFVTIHVNSPSNTYIKILELLINTLLVNVFNDMKLCCTFLRGYLQGSENGRVVTIGNTRQIKLGEKAG